MIASLNHDTIPDIALVNKASNDVSIMLGNGTGRFTFAAGSPEGLGIGSAEPVAVVSGDFDSDGDIDLAVAAEGSNDVVILKNDGAGNFSASSISLGSGDAPMVITAGYFDGDGSLDLAVGRENGDVEILLNNGSDGFSPAVGSPVSTSANDPVSLEAADLNADSIPDLALIGEGGSTIHSERWSRSGRSRWSA